MMEVQTVMKRIRPENRLRVKRQSVRVVDSNEDMETIGTRVRALREAAKGKDGGPLSRQELADAVGMAKTTLQTLEDKPQESTKKLAQLADYFGVNARWLATGKGPRQATHPINGSPELTQEKHLQESVTESQTLRISTPILVEAGKTLDLLETVEGRPTLLPTDQLEGWMTKLAAMYGVVVEAGGEIGVSQLQDMMRAAIQRRELGVKDEHGKKGRRGTRDPK